MAQELRHCDLACDIVFTWQLLVPVFVEGLFTLALASVVVSAKSFLFALFLLPPTAPHSVVGHGHDHSSKHHAIFECGAVGKKEKIESSLHSTPHS